MNHLDGWILHLQYLLELQSSNKCVIKKLKKTILAYFYGCILDVKIDLSNYNIN